jgi:hypothetical protein
MRILIGNLAKTIFLLIIAIILCSYTLYTTAQVRVLSYNEEIDYDVLPRVWDSKSFDDGTMIVRIIRKNATSSINNYLCFHEMLSLRIINLDGTVEEKDLKLNVQAFNYCVFQKQIDGIYLEFMTYNLIRKNQLLITYYNATDINNPYTYFEWGMVIDYNGNILDRSLIGLPFIDIVNRLRIVIPSSEIRLNINRGKGFIRVNENQDLTIGWKQFRIEYNAWNNYKVNFWKNSSLWRRYYVNLYYEYSC